MFYIPITSEEAWRSQLADPEKHWRDGYSAKCLAMSWLNAHGMPPKVQLTLQDSNAPVLYNLECALCFPEHKVQLPGGSRASQSDIFILGSNKLGLVSIVVEGKCKESFGEYVNDWLQPTTQGKQERLNYLTSLLGTSPGKVFRIRYQLLHRTASALVEGSRYFCRSAIVIVHSFDESPESYSDWEQFLSLYGLHSSPNTVSGPIRLSGIDLFFTWVQDTFPEMNH